MKPNRGAAGVRQGVWRSGAVPFLTVRSTYSSRQPYATHFHDCLSLGVVFEGGTLLRRGGVPSVIAPGEMALIAPFEPHSCNPLRGRVRGYHMLYIDSEWVLSVLGAPSGGRIVVEQSGVFSDSGLFDSMMCLADAVRCGAGDAAACRALEGIIAARCGVRAAAEYPASGHLPFDHPVFSAWGDGASVAEGAAALGMRRESFIRSFRRVTGMTPLKYRHCMRLIRAGGFLRRGRGLAETALACGFADQSHFHRMCVRYLAATPVQMIPRTIPCVS